RYPPFGLKFSANFTVFCAISRSGLALPPPGDLSYGGLGSPPTPRHNCRTLSQGVPMAVAQKIPSADAKTVADFSREQELSAYRTMLTIRRFEEKAGQMYGMGLIGGFCHLYIGQEAVVVGMKLAMRDGDQMITGYRDHGHMLACGMDPKGVMAELTGRRGGYSNGKGGSMHMFSVAKNFYGGHG